MNSSLLRISSQFTFTYRRGRCPRRWRRKETSPVRRMQTHLPFLQWGLQQLSRSPFICSAMAMTSPLLASFIVTTIQDEHKYCSLSYNLLHKYTKNCRSRGNLWQAKWTPSCKKPTLSASMPLRSQHDTSFKHRAAKIGVGFATIWVLLNMEAFHTTQIHIK